MQACASWCRSAASPTPTTGTPPWPRTRPGWARRRPRWPRPSASASRSTTSSARQPRSAADAIANWQEHLDGKPKYAPPIPPLAPAKLAGSLYVALGGRPLPECVDYAASLQAATAPFVQTATSRIAETTNGMLGFMFWAAERPAVRGIGTVPPNTCEGGLGAAATALAIHVPMPPLRQE